ncbi:MAG: hypothetical protein K8U57_20915 [Planctomycetes bacterium]|nr:hypothetical protein [Planctomycetota bacterium]
MPNETAEGQTSSPLVAALGGKVGEKEKYAATVALIGASEATSVSRFNAFLVFSAILAAGWVQLATRSDTLGGKLAMSLFCLLGAVAGYIWAGIGGRSRSYVELYRKIGEGLERSGDTGSTPENSPCLGATAFRAVTTNRYRKEMEENAGANKLFFTVPLVVSGMFLLLLVPTWYFPVLSPPPLPVVQPVAAPPVPDQPATTQKNDSQPQKVTEPSKR